MNKKVFAPVAVLFFGFFWLWVAMEVVEFGSRWQSVGIIRNNVIVTLQNDQELKGTLTRGWEGSYNLVDRNGKNFVFRDFKIMSIPAEGQIKAGFPYKTVLPFAIYFLISLAGLSFLNKRVAIKRDGRG
ncbi:hypothetical protein [Aeromonas salmonicida]|uniref:hypothetical protein n=1 Tax=Aeromonas salmonicida TaxID=645 RepID=UPI000B402AB5|nr:hypothetical protein [Aeromonas salmonicida]ARW85390.1 hypothetical protein O23A_P4p0022 [Aeromonas salmonicida]